MTSTSSISHAMGSISEYRPTGVSKTVQLNVQPSNIQEFTSSGTTRSVWYDLPPLDNAVLDPSLTRLTCNIQPTVGGCSFANGSAEAVIKSVQTMCGSVQQEQLDNADGFTALSNDHMPSNVHKTIGALTRGASSTDHKVGRTLTTDTERYSLPLPSTFSGSLCESYPPMLHGNRLRLEFETGVNALVHATGAEYKMSEMVLSLTYLVLEPSAYASLMKESGGVAKIHSAGVSCFSTTLNLQNSKHDILIPGRFSSVRSIYSVIRESDNQGLSTANVCGSRINPGLLSYTWKVNSQLVNSPVICGSQSEVYAGEQFSEVVRGFSNGKS
jgi:hypothetical protein